MINRFTNYTVHRVNNFFVILEETYFKVGRELYEGKYKNKN